MCCCGVAGWNGGPGVGYAAMDLRLYVSLTRERSLGEAGASYTPQVLSNSGLTMQVYYFILHHTVWHYYWMVERARNRCICHENTYSIKNMYKEHVRVFLDATAALAMWHGWHRSRRCNGYKLCNYTTT